MGYEDKTRQGRYLTRQEQSENIDKIQKTIDLAGKRLNMIQSKKHSITS